MRLHEIDAALRDLMDSADDGELDGTLAAEMDALALAREQKIQGCLIVAREQMAHALALNDEIKRLQSLKIRAEDRAEWCRGYVKYSMQAAGETKLDLPLFKARLQKNPPSVVITVPAEELPALFRNERLEVTANKKMLLAAWRERQPMPKGVTVVQEASLRVS